jgi:uncharacterized membrane protein (DUF485 family)
VDRLITRFKSVFVVTSNLRMGALRKKVGDVLRIDHILIVIDFAFFILAIFFSGFTSQVADTNLRTQLVALSSSFFVGGVVIVIALVVLYVFKETFFRKREPE